MKAGFNFNNMLFFPGLLPHKQMAVKLRSIIIRPFALPFACLLCFSSTKNIAEWVCWSKITFLRLHSDDMLRNRLFKKLLYLGKSIQNQQFYVFVSFLQETDTFNVIAFHKLQPTLERATVLIPRYGRYL